MPHNKNSPKTNKNYLQLKLHFRHVSKLKKFFYALLIPVSRYQLMLRATILSYTFLVNESLLPSFLFLISNARL